MSHIKRRQFLQFAGSTLATISLSQFDLIKQGDRYGKVLAQSTPRKFALLVGINDYPNSERFKNRNLQGCLNDVELQRNLLIYRFGFNPNDIKTLTNQEATRENILMSFEKHLIEQAKPGDVVVFHFSGHGSRVADPYGVSLDGLNSTFVPANDSSLAEQGIVNDIMGRTLFLLMFALKQKTENVTVVLDSCHSGGGIRGNIRVRAVRGGKDLSASPTELEYQQQWLKRLNISLQEFHTSLDSVATGVVIASAKPKQFAADYEFNGFHAGAFTYFLTQYLWQQTSDVASVMDKVSRNVKSLASNQEPLFEAKRNSGNDKKPVYFLEKQKLPAEAVITQLNEKEATLWLGGISRDSLESFGEGATFITLASSEGGAKPTTVELKSRDGLVGKAIVIEGTAQTGALLQEFARVIPSDWKLQIGLDPSLGSEATAAQQTLQALNRIEALLSQPGNKPYPKEVHYILSRITTSYHQQLQQNQAGEIPPENSIGLFSPSLELIPKSFEQPGETVAKAITRLKPKLKSLLAARVVKMTLNAESSRMNLEVTMTLEGQNNKLIGQAFTPRGCQGEPAPCPDLGSRGGSQQLPVGAPFQFQVTNLEKKALYLGILLIDPTDGIVVLFPNEYQQLSAEEQVKTTIIEASQKLLIPDPAKDKFRLATKEAGVGEVLVIASQKPLTAALLRLQSLAKKQEPDQRTIEVRGDDAVNVIDDLIDDLSSKKRGPIAGAEPRDPIPASQMAALSITFEVV